MVGTCWGLATCELAAADACDPLVCELMMSSSRTCMQLAIALELLGNAPLPGQQRLLACL